MMLNRTLLYIVFSVFPLYSLKGQTGEWALHLQGPAHTKSTHVTTDTKGNVIIAGEIAGPVDFDPGAGVFELDNDNGLANGMDLFIAKYDSLKTLIWAKKLSCSIFIHASDIVCDSNDNVYVTGSYMGDLDLDPDTNVLNQVSTVGSDWNIYLLKLNASGIFSWGSSFGQSDDDVGMKIAYDYSSNIYLFASFSGSTDFDPSPATYNVSCAGFSDFVVAKYDTSGTLEFAFSLGTGMSEMEGSMTCDKQGNIYLGCYFNGNLDVDPGTGVHTLNFPQGSGTGILKYNSSGVLLHSGILDGYILIRNNCVSNNNSVYFTGDYQLLCDFDPGSGNYNMTTNNSMSMFVLKCDSALNFTWAIGTQNLTPSNYGLCFVNGIAADENDNVIVSGSFYGNMDVNPGPGTQSLASGNYDDFFIVKYSAYGGYIWSLKGGLATSFEEATDVCSPSTGILYYTGTFGGNCDFVPGPSSLMLNSSDGIVDGFLVKLSDYTIGITEVKPDEIFIYPNPGYGIFNLSLANSEFVAGGSYSVYNTSMQCVESGRLQTTIGGKTQIDVNGLAAGLYFLTIETPGKWLNAKLIIK